ncbi:hypothetical protein [Chryseobacterium cucumeris]|nr:hypothetical protein [Chryseobacterium cucumeris]
MTFENDTLQQSELNNKNNAIENESLKEEEYINRILEILGNKTD